MNVNKICAAVSALCFAGTAAMLAMNSRQESKVSAVSNLLGDVNGNGVVDGVDASTILAYYAYASAGHDGTTLEQFMAMRNSGTSTTAQTTTAPTTTTTAKPSDNIKLKSGGDTFTIAVWNADDVPRLVSKWLNVSEDDVNKSEYDYSLSYYDRLRNPDIALSSSLKTPYGSNLHIINFGIGGGDAPEKYENMFKAGDDIDVYYCEPDWMNKFTNYDNLTAPLSDLGFTDEDFAQCYSYTEKLGHNSKGVRKAAAFGVSPGGFAYRTDLARLYLGINSPEEMQKAIGTWDGFVSTATKLASLTYGKCALADSVGGMFQAYCIQNQTIGSDGTMTENAKTFADYAKTLWINGGVTKNSQWTDKWTADGANDKVMGYFVSTWGIEQRAFMGIASDNSIGKWEMVKGPDNFYWGGMWTVVSPKTDNADDCASFIRSSCLDSSSMLASAKSDTNYLPNNKAAVAEMLKSPKSYPLYDKSIFVTDNFMKVFANTAENITPVTVSYDSQPTDTYHAFSYAIFDEYLRNGSTWSEAQAAYNKKRSY